jgi:hypothetical protein
MKPFRIREIFIITCGMGLARDFYKQVIFHKSNAGKYISLPRFQRAQFFRGPSGNRAFFDYHLALSANTLTSAEIIQPDTRNGGSIEQGTSLTDLYFFIKRQETDCFK